MVLRNITWARFPDYYPLLCKFVLSLGELLKLKTHSTNEASRCYNGFKENIIQAYLRHPFVHFHSAHPST